MGRIKSFPLRNGPVSTDIARLQSTQTSLEEVLRRLSPLWVDFPRSIWYVVDILLVAWILYRILKLIRGTRAWRIAGGIAVFVLALFLSDLLQLRTLNWLLDKATLLAPVALVLLLLPEIRQALEGFAKLGLWPDRLPGSETTFGADVLEEIVAAVSELAGQRVGALIVMERNTKLDDIAANGVQVNALVTTPLLGAIFYHGNPLHDGAAIIRNNRVSAAACRLPLSENPSLPSHLHMRHRAGIGISEQSDALVVIVSEERGVISVAKEGRLETIGSPKELREVLNREVRGVWADKPQRPRRMRRLRGPEAIDGQEKPNA